VHDEIQNATLDAIVRCCDIDNSYPVGRDIKLLYDVTLHDSPVRRLIVDMYCRRGGEDWIDDGPQEVSTAFMRNCLRAIIRKRFAPMKEPPWGINTVLCHVGARGCAKGEEETQDSRSMGQRAILTKALQPGRTTNNTLIPLNRKPSYV
jgi:hypothetical protein